MNVSGSWSRRVKRGLEQAGFKVTLADPTLAIKRKKRARRSDLERLANGTVSPRGLQNRNSIFAGRAKDFRILDYGGLNKK